METFIAAIVSLGSLFIVASIIYQVEKGQNTGAIVSAVQNVNQADVAALFS